MKILLKCGVLAFCVCGLNAESRDAWVQIYESCPKAVNYVMRTFPKAGWPLISSERGAGDNRQLSFAINGPDADSVVPRDWVLDQAAARISPRALVMDFTPILFPRDTGICEISAEFTLLDADGAEHATSGAGELIILHALAAHYVKTQPWIVSLSQIIGQVADAIPPTDSAGPPGKAKSPKVKKEPTTK